MKLTFKRQYPLATRGANLKQTSQQGSPLRKLTLKQKGFYRKTQRVFSLEYGKYLHKRILWKIVSTNRPTSFPKTLLMKFKTFHSKILSKKWLLDNMTLAPGVVWPLKNKKFLVAKMRAFKTLSHLVQARNLKVLIQTIQKLWNLQTTKPSVWGVASGVDSLKAHVLLKSGLAPTRSAANALSAPRAQAASQLPETLSTRKQTFVYPGDFCSFDSNPAFLWSLLFSAGPTKVFQIKKKNRRAAQSAHKRPTSIHTANLFQWVAFFYKNGHLKNRFAERAQSVTVNPNLRSQKPFASFRKNQKSF